MRYVTKFLIMLLLVFYLSFCSFGAGVAYANDVTIPFSVSTMPSSIIYYSSIAGSSRTELAINNFTLTPANSVNVASQFFNDGFATWRYTNFVGNIYRFDSFRIPISFSVSDLPFETDNLSVLYEPDLTFFVDNSEYLYLPAIFQGTITFNFSDGSSSSYGIASNNGTLDISVSKDNHSNEYLLSSEDFNLSAENAEVSSQNAKLTSGAASFVSKNADFISRNAVNSSSKVSVSTKVATLSTDSASLSSEGKASLSSADTSASLRAGSLTSRSGNSNISSSGSIGNSIYGSGGSNTIGSIATPDNAVTSKSAVNSAIRSFALNTFSFALNYANLSSFSLSDVSFGSVSFSLSAADFAVSSASLSFTNGEFSFNTGSLYSTGNFFGQDGELTANSGQFGLADGDFSVSDSDFAISELGVINDAPVTLNKSSEDVYITGFSFSGSLLVGTYLVPSFQLPDDFQSPSMCYFAMRSYFSYNTDTSIGNAILSRLDKIYYSLRFDLPLYLRHLLIPTTEEVSDVIEEAVENVKNNAGGLGQAVGAVDEDIKAFTEFLTSEVTGSFYIPAAVINVNNESYMLWDDFDVAPYFKAEPIQDMTSFLVPFLEFLVASALIYHLYYMWISLLSGASYFAFLKGIKSLYDAEDD